LERRRFLTSSLATSVLALAHKPKTYAFATSAADHRDYHFNRTISRKVLDNYLSRAITMQSLYAGEANFDDNMRMLKYIGAKFIGRSLCLWGGEDNFVSNVASAKQQLPQAIKTDPTMVFEACVFEIVTHQLNDVPVPDWVFTGLGVPVEKRNFRYEDMLYPDGRRVNQWGQGSSVPDVSRPETKLWFHYQSASYINAGFEAIHWGQMEIMNGNDPHLDHWSEVLTRARAHAAKHARRHMLICDAHVPHGGLVRNGHLLLDFHAFPLRIMEMPDHPEDAMLKVGFSDGLYLRSKGGITPSGWSCEHLPYLVEFDNYGVSRTPGEPRAKGGGVWIWGYDEISWFAHQPKEYREMWLRYAWNWVRDTDPNGYLEMPGSRQTTNGFTRPPATAATSSTAGTTAASTTPRPRGRRTWYEANNPSPATPDGYGDEDAIREIWANSKT
jgi:hypothetical protein